MTATKQKHTHKYRRVRFKSGNTVLFCSLPDCNNKINPSLALGKRSICWRCGEEFFLNEYSIRLAKPHCTNCHKGKNGRPIDQGQVNGIINELEGTNISLADRLSETIASAAKQEEDI